MKITQQTFSLEDLLIVMRKLRDPQEGCPWDQQQTFETIAPYTIEESYEVADAILRGDRADLCDELGDLLFQVVYHAQMAVEEEAFSFDDVVTAICQKMIRRHPHVFGNTSVSDKEEVRRSWEEIKTAERKAKNGTQEEHSLLDQVAVGLPPLKRAYKLQRKAALARFDWSDVKPVLEKLREEVVELEEAIVLNHPEEKIEEELGDVLFSAVNVSRHLHVNPELALQRANRKFEDRFRIMERLARQRNVSLSDLNADELEELWQCAKRKIQNG